MAEYVQCDHAYDVQNREHFTLKFSELGIAAPHRVTTAKYMTNNQLYKEEYSAVSSSRKETSNTEESAT
jgi:hypothetical protein